MIEKSQNSVEQNFRFTKKYLYFAPINQYACFQSLVLTFSTLLPIQISDR